MRRSTEVLAGLILAVVLHTAFGKISPSLLIVFNTFSWVVISRTINVLPPSRTFVFVLIMASVELALWKFLVLFLFGEKWSAAGGLVFLQPLFTAVFVTLLFQFKRKAGAEIP
jgi:hypothetical protein